MNIPALGHLKFHPRISRWLISDPREIPLLDGKKLKFIIDGLKEADEPDINQAVAAFLALTKKDREAAGHYVFCNYQKIARIMDDEDLGCRINSAAEVWDCLCPSVIFVERRRRNQEIYVRISAECAWEREHGLQIVYRKGSILSRVSQQDGHLTYTDARNLPEDQDRIA